ncbi:hypothetical protein M1O57_02855 [Dehalococcoidia bacterium]|nr:hypothetical protein [Dehalococcoidia bacterium]MCL0104514.1 hypothetical protein [Dehalococcoidia bacterium]
MVASQSRSRRSAGRIYFPVINVANAPLVVPCPLPWIFSPIKRLAQMGMEAEIAESKAIWLCASCITCAARCPRGCDLSRVMEALRLLTLRKNVDAVEPSRIPEETLADLPQIALVSCLRKFTA